MNNIQSILEAVEQNTELPRANEAIRVLVEGLEKIEALRDGNAILYEGACSKLAAELLTRAHAILTGAQ